MSDAKPNEQTSLYYREGSSDKEYHVQLRPHENGYLVEFRFGRRGSALTAGSKTATAVPYAKAKSIYEKLVREKVAKGYSTGDAGVAYQNSSLEERFTGVAPQLLNPIEDGELEELLCNATHGMQEKKDGQRRLIRKAPASGVEGINRKGLIVALPMGIAASVSLLAPTSLLLDGEIIGETLYLFDLLESSDDSALSSRPYAQRFGELEHLLEHVQSPLLRCVALVTSSKAKRTLFDLLKSNQAEGVVFKDLRAPHAPGRPASGGSQLKYKFVQNATCRVVKMNNAKRSAVLELRDTKGQWVVVGNVTIPPNYPIPKNGDLVEVRYLYANLGGSLYQPVYQGKRTDLDTEAATLSQLKYKPESSEDDESTA